LSLLTGLVGGSALTYLLAVVHVSLPWALVILLTVLLIIGLVGSYLAWSEQRQAALRFQPTWEHIQTRADNLRALVNEHEHREGFKQQYMAGHMTTTRRDYDRAVAAGYPPQFDRDRIGNAEMDDVRELIVALDDVVRRWRADEGAGQA
jgi:hypothetical protein